MIYIVTYDIKFDCIDDPSAQKRLKDISEVLCNYGLRRQRSIFECIMDSPKLEKMKKEISEVIDRDKDSVRIYVLCEKCLKKAVVQGVGEIVDIKEYAIV
ncbi:MAG TPA: CRISPR-associated endonuclease Cas2 [Desulfomonilia bacterium]